MFLDRLPLVADISFLIKNIVEFRIHFFENSRDISVFAQKEISEMNPRVRIFDPHFCQISEIFLRIYPYLGYLISDISEIFG